MMLAPLRGEPPAVEGLAIDVVDGPALGEIFAAIHAGGFGIPKELAALFVAPGIRDTPGLTHYVGWLHGRPAATASRVTTGRVAGLYNIATAAEFRGRGIATAITWQAALDGIAEGCEVSVLQASAMGYRVYQAMGFQQVADYRSWYWLGRA
jgi:GNAT superfamily N-acetyltransferase